MKRFYTTIIACVLSVVTMQAQTSAEAIIGSCPTMPSDNDIAEFMVKGENANVKKYFQQLGEATRNASGAASQEFSTKDFAKEQANMEKKQKQLVKKANNRAEAGKIMMKFMQTLTPAQRKKFESFRSEADAMQYLASIGKLDELSDLMEGVPGAKGDESVVGQADMQVMTRDLSDELEAVNTPIFDLEEKLSALNIGLKDKAEEAEQNSIEAHKDNDGGKAGGLWDTEAVENDMIAFWATHVAARKKLLVDYMQAIRNAIPVAKMRDKQQNTTRKMTGQDPLRALESSEFGRAMSYLGAAQSIFPINARAEEVREMMEDNTQEININEE